MRRSDSQGCGNRQALAAHIGHLEAKVADLFAGLFIKSSGIGAARASASAHRKGAGAPPPDPPHLDRFRGWREVASSAKLASTWSMLSALSVGMVRPCRG